MEQHEMYVRRIGTIFSCSIGQLYIMRNSLCTLHINLSLLFFNRTYFSLLYIFFHPLLISVYLLHLVELIHYINFFFGFFSSYAGDVCLMWNVCMCACMLQGVKKTECMMREVPDSAIYIFFV